MADKPLKHDHSGDKNPKWKGGKTHDGHGRILVYRPSHPRANSWGYVYRYRLVMEEKLGRYLLPTEIVHHKDENESNDDPYNLEVTTQSLHIRIHLPKMHNDKWRDSRKKINRNSKGQFHVTLL
ncbi:MAG: HNH endonuclease [Patescibacteria group bacterium]|nr:HNH endonuclease [Patescibacteria group bacterium]